MKEILSKKTKILDQEVILSVYTKGEDLVVIVDGPNDHLGGVGMGTPYINRKGLDTANMTLFSFPNHRDGELAGRIAQKIAKKTRKKVVVILGFHFDKIKEKEIGEIFHQTDLIATTIGNDVYRLLKFK